MFWKKKPLDLRFNDITRMAYQYHPIRMAKEVPSHFQEHQVKKFGTFNFANCPGTMDLRNYGYIVEAWDDIEILANKSGIVCYIGSMKGKRKSAFKEPTVMDERIADGIFEPQGIPLKVFHLGSPWSIEVQNKKISALVTAAPFHSPFLDDIYVYPGIVDYGKFNTLNFIFSVKRAGKITIKAGTPLLQVIPFETRDIKAGYGPADDYQIDASRSIFSSTRQFYRKYVAFDKRTSIKLDEKTKDE